MCYPSASFPIPCLANVVPAGQEYIWSILIYFLLFCAVYWILEGIWTQIIKFIGNPLAALSGMFPSLGKLGIPGLGSVASGIPGVGSLI